MNYKTSENKLHQFHTIRAIIHNGKNFRYENPL